MSRSDKADIVNIHDRSVGLVTSLVKIYPDLASTRFRIHSVLRKVPLWSGERIQKVEDWYARFTESYIRCGRTVESTKEKLQIQNYPDTSGRGLILTDWGVKLIFNYTRDCVYYATLP